MVAESTVNSMIQTLNNAIVMQLPVDLTKKLQLGSFSRHVADRKLQKNEETINISFSLASLIALISAVVHFIPSAGATGPFRPPRRLENLMRNRLNFNFQFCELSAVKNWTKESIKVYAHLKLCSWPLTKIIMDTRKSTTMYVAEVIPN